GGGGLWAGPAGGGYGRPRSCGRAPSPPPFRGEAMSRRSFLVAVGIFALALSSLGAGLYVLARHVPHRYANATLPEGPDLNEQSDLCVQKVFDLHNAIKNERPFQAKFTDAQINSYLNSGLDNMGLRDKVLPEAVTEPRVTIEEDRVRIAFRYGSGFWSTVVSLDLRIWVPELQPNVVVVQLLGLQAGALP